MLAAKADRSKLRPLVIFKARERTKHNRNGHQDAGEHMDDRRTDNEVATDAMGRSDSNKSGQCWYGMTLEVIKLIG